jgi:hypothetical protein
LATDGVDHIGRDDARFVDHESGTNTILPGPTPSLLFLVHSLEHQDLTIFPPPLTILLGLNSHHLPHSFLAGHGFSVPSGTFDREQAKSERHTPGSSKDQSTADSGQIHERPSIP